MLEMLNIATIKHIKQKNRIENHILYHYRLKAVSRCLPINVSPVWVEARRFTCYQLRRYHACRSS